MIISNNILRNRRFTLKIKFIIRIFMFINRDVYILLSIIK